MSVAWKNIRSRLWKDVSGTAAIEMAIVFPIFLMVVFGIVVFGIYIGATHSTQQLAADAARASISGLDAREREALAVDYVKRNAANYALVFADSIDVKASPSPENPDDFKVVVSYDASALPIWGFSAFVAGPMQTIERTAVVHRGGMR